MNTILSKTNMHDCLYRISFHNSLLSIDISTSRTLLWWSCECRASNWWIVKFNVYRCCCKWHYETLCTMNLKTKFVPLYWVNNEDCICTESHDSICPLKVESVAHTCTMTYQFSTLPQHPLQILHSRPLQIFLILWLLYVCIQNCIFTLTLYKKNRNWADNTNSYIHGKVHMLTINVTN